MRLFPKTILPKWPWIFGQRQGGAEGEWQRYVTDPTTQPLSKETSKRGRFFAGNLDHLMDFKLGKAAGLSVLERSVLAGGKMPGVMFPIMIA